MVEPCDLSTGEQQPAAEQHVRLGDGHALLGVRRAVVGWGAVLGRAALAAEAAVENVVAPARAALHVQPELPRLAVVPRERRDVVIAGGVAQAATAGLDHL